MHFLHQKIVVRMSPAVNNDKDVAKLLVVCPPMYPMYHVQLEGVTMLSWQ